MFGVWACNNGGGETMTTSEQPGVRQSAAGAWIALARPGHWIKNVVVLLPLMMSLHTTRYSGEGGGARDERGSERAVQQVLPAGCSMFMCVTVAGWLLQPAGEPIALAC